MTATISRVYVARLAGTAIFDPAGDQVGRVSDVVVRPRRSAPPRVLGIVAEIQAFRRIFVPMGRVTDIDAGAVVLSTPTLDLRKFGTRPGELLVIGELLDRDVTIVDNDTTSAGHVVDVAMEPDRIGQWVLRRVAVRVRAKRLSRRGPLREEPWDQVQGLIATPTAQSAASLLSATEDLRPADVANMVQDLPLQRRLALATALDDPRLADVLEELPDHDQVQLLNSLERERAAHVLGEMDPDDAADLLGAMPAGDKLELLSLMEPSEADPVRQLLQYRPGTAGGLMTSEPVILTPDTAVAVALAHIRRRALPATLAAQVFVCRPPVSTPTGPYLGMAHFQRLLREPPSTLLAACVDTDIDPIGPQLTLLDITRRLAAYDLVALPVVIDDRLHGAVTVDDVLDELLPSDWRDRDYV